MIRISKFLVIAALMFAACSTEDEGDINNGHNLESFDRAAMLTNWADNIIVPAFVDFNASTQLLEEATVEFTSNPSEAKLADLRSAFKSSYLKFQNVAMYDVGKAEEINFRRFLNTYPLDASAVDNKIASGEYNLQLPSSFKEQGFPALDYLLNGIGSTDAEIVSKFNSDNYKNYLLDVSKRINSLTGEVNNSWQGDYRDSFVSNISSSSTGSVDKLTNKYIMYFETFLRSGKIGYPSGVFTGTPSPVNVEAYYSPDLSKELYVQSLRSVTDFFIGKHYNSSQTGKSFKQYLEFLDRKDLASDILNQFNAINSQSSSLNESLKNQVETNNNIMLAAYDELQKAVVLLKLDMVQALSISINYVDSDGD